MHNEHIFFNISGAASVSACMCRWLGIGHQLAYAAYDDRPVEPFSVRCNSLALRLNTMSHTLVRVL